MSRPAAAPTPLAAELALVVLSLAVAGGYVRVFVGWDWAPTLAAGVIGGHLCAAVARRVRMPIWVALPLTVALGALCAVARFAQDTTRYGLPTRDSLTVLRELGEQAWTAFPEAIAPVPADGGFLLIAFAGCWLTATLADAFAFRAGAAIEALVPPAVAFVTCSMVADDRLRVASAGAATGAAVLFVVLHRVWVSTSGAGWLRPAGSRSLVLSAGMVAIIAAIAIGVAAAPSLPGAGEQSLVDYKGREDDTRITLSPLVDVRGRLAGQSGVVAFRASTTAPAYWRLTSLDTFDGSTWTSSRRFSETDGSLDDAPELGTEVRQEVVIDQLASSYLPAAYSPVRVEGVTGLSWDSDSATLLVDDDTDEGDRYVLTSRILLPSTERLQAATADGDGISDRYFDLPDGLPSVIGDTARAFTTGTTTPYEQAKALQDNLRRFSYDLGIRTPAGTEPISWFLSIQRGYCEQFSGAFAVMARELGLPARVAVGFTPGETLGDGTVEVRGQHAHAWPEVWFDGIGWVAFEPTPSRGIPGASYTGVPFQQSGQAPTDEVAVPTTTVAPDPSAPQATNPIRNPDAGIPAPDFGDGSTPVDDGPSPWPRRVLITLAGLLAIAAAWPLAIRSIEQRRRRVRRSGASTPAAQVTVAWSEAVEALEQVGLGPQPSETEHEYVVRTSKADPDVAEPLRRLGELTVAAGYGVTDPDAAEVGQAWADARAITTSCRETMDRRQRTRVWLDPRPPSRRRGTHHQNLRAPARRPDRG